jgi:hypothetical protein
MILRENNIFRVVNRIYRISFFLISKGMVFKIIISLLLIKEISGINNNNNKLKFIITFKIIYSLIILIVFRIKMYPILVIFYKEMKMLNKINNNNFLNFLNKQHSINNPIIKMHKIKLHVKYIYFYTNILKIKYIKKKAMKIQQ